MRPKRVTLIALLRLGESSRVYYVRPDETLLEWF
jgi:hypothetical protein